MHDKNRYYLANVTLKNYRTYQGETKIDLSCDSDRPLTIIHGEMGKGKTTLLGAIYWCLYGKIRSSFSDSENDETIINSDIIKHLEVGQSNEMFVEIKLLERNILRYIIRRTITFTKTSRSAQNVLVPNIGGRISAGIDLKSLVEFKYLQPTNKDWIVLNAPDGADELIEAMFPEQLSSYFLFDAELLNDFFNDNNGEHVKNGIEKISGLPVLVNAIDHLKKISKKIQVDVAHGETRLEPIQAQIDLIERRIKKKKSQISEINKNLKDHNKEINSLELFMSENSIERIRDIQKRIDQYDDEIKDIKSIKNKHEKEFNSWLVLTNTKIQLREYAAKSLAKCKTWEQEGKIPMAVSNNALEMILSGVPSVCICGTLLSEGSEERKKVVTLKERVNDSSIAQHILSGMDAWDEICDETGNDQIKDELDKFRNERDNFSTRYNSAIDAKDKLVKERSEHNHEDVSTKSAQLVRLKDEKIRFEANKLNLEDEITDCESDLDSERERLDTEIGKNEKYHRQSEKIKLAKKFELTLTRCRDELIDELRDRVGIKTTEYFLKLVTKDDFSRIKIQKGYKTIALGKDENTKTLSAGQKCCLALAYIAAIQDIAEKNYFMIIDSPLHNISQEERVDIAKNLPIFMPKTQITLLVQDQEYTGRANKSITGIEIPSVRETMLENGVVWKEYLLEVHKRYDDDSHHTTIRSVGDYSG